MEEEKWKVCEQKTWLGATKSEGTKKTAREYWPKEKNRKKREMRKSGKQREEPNWLIKINFWGSKKYGLTD